MLRHDSGVSILVPISQKKREEMGVHSLGELTQRKVGHTQIVPPKECQAHKYMRQEFLPICLNRNVGLLFFCLQLKKKIINCGKKKKFIKFPHNNSPWKIQFL